MQLTVNSISLKHQVIGLLQTMVQTHNEMKNGLMFDADTDEIKSSSIQ